MGYQAIDPGSLAGPGSSPFVDAMMKAREESRLQEQNRWQQIAEQGRSERDQQRIGMDQAAQGERLAKEHQDYTAQHTLKAMELDAAGMPLQAEAYAALHNIPFVGSHRAPQGPGDAAGATQPGQAPTGQPGQQPQQEAAPGPQGGPPQQPQAPVYSGGGIAGLNVDAASRNVAAVGQPGPAQAPMEGPPAPQPEQPPPPMPGQPTPAPAMTKGPAHRMIQTPRGPVEFDPMEAQHAERSQNAERADFFRSVLSKDPSLAPYAGEAGAQVQLGLEDPKAVFAGVRSEMAAKAKDAETEKKEASRIAHEKEFSPQAFSQAKELAHINAGGRVQAATAGKTDANNDKVISLLDRRAKALRDSTQFSKLVQADKTVRGLMVNIADGTVPLQHGDAQIQLARYFRQAQPTEGEMHQLYSRLGGTMDKWDQFVANMENGDLSPEQIRQIQVSAQAVKKEDAEDKSRFVKVARNYLGPKSGLDLVPDQAENLFRGMAAELGMDDLPPLYETEGGITLGSGKKPQVHSKPAKAGTEKPTELHGPGGKVLKLGPDGMYH